MKIKILVLAIALSFMLSLSVGAQQQTIEICGAQIPLIEGAVLLKGVKAPLPEVKILTYIVDKPLAEVVEFYESFLSENNFLLIGGREDSGFNVSVKKDEILFSLQIYSRQNQTIIQFVW